MGFQINFVINQLKSEVTEYALLKIAKNYRSIEFLNLKSNQSRDNLIIKDRSDAKCEIAYCVNLITNLCDCFFLSKYNIPCRHLLFVWKIKKLDISDHIRRSINPR